MPTRSSKLRREETDPNVSAFRTVQQATGQIPSGPRPAMPMKNPHAVALGILGGSKGGKARAAKLPPRKRKQIARKAARARWSKRVT